MVMVVIAFVSLVLGVVCGRFLFTPEVAAAFPVIADWALYVLMLAVGISVGANKVVFQKLREYHVKVLIIPLGIMAGSAIGGLICSLVLRLPLRDGLGVTSGLGWYSLSGVLVTELAGAQMGTVAFLSNLMRELLSFLTIPFLAKHLNRYAAIAPAAATSEDTTLPLLMKVGGEDIAVMAVLNGVICSTAVPILISFFYSVF